MNATLRRLLPPVLMLALVLTAHADGDNQSLEFVSPPTGKKFIRWYGVTGWTYFVQVSDPADHLKTWTFAPIIEGGKNETISYEIDEPPEGLPDKGFFRLKYTDQPLAPGETVDTADFDGDGISNKDEVDPPEPLAPTDPLNPDTDGDGLPDGWERAHGLNPNDSSDAANLFPGSNVSNLQAFNAGVQANPNATMDNFDGDDRDNVDDADPNDGTIDWKRTADPRFAVIELPASDPNTLSFNDVSPNGTVLFERNDYTRLVIDRNLIPHTVTLDMHPPVGEFGGAWSTLIEDKVLGRKTTEYQTENCLWDPIDNSYTSYNTDRYYDFIHDARDGFLVKQSRYGNDQGLGTHLGQLMGCTDFWDARIEGNGNIVARNEYWRYDPVTSSYGTAITLPATSVSRSATLIQEDASQPPTKRTWNLVAGSTKLLVSAENAAFVASDVAYPTSQHPVGVTSQGWVATDNQIWSNGTWKPLKDLLGETKPQQAILLGILDTGIGVAKIQYDTGPEKIVLLIPGRIDVDTNRDGKIDAVQDAEGNDQWTSSRGAIYSVNFDRDEDNTTDIPVADAITWSETEGTPINENWTISSASDEEDITPFKITVPDLPIGAKVYLTLAETEDLHAIHIFPRIKAGKDCIWGGYGTLGCTWTDESGSSPLDIEITQWLKPVDDEPGASPSSVGVKAGTYTFGLEGLLFRGMGVPNGTLVGKPGKFSGIIELGLELMLPGQAGHKKFGAVQMKVAPFLLLPNKQDAENVFVAGMATIPNGPYDPSDPLTDKDMPQEYIVYDGLSSWWMQDHVEIGYSERPFGPVTKIALVCPYTDHLGNPTLSQWPYDQQIGAFSLGKILDGSVNAGNYGGNIELSNPQEGHPHGRILCGMTMSSTLTEFLDAQEMQDLYSVDLSFADVQHIDEVISPGPDGKTYMANPDAAITLLEANFQTPQDQLAGVFFSTDEA